MRDGEEGTYLVQGGFVRDVFDVAVDVIHGIGLCGNILFGGLGDGVVLGDVCHFVCLLVLLKYCARFWYWYVIDRV